jgi:deoxyribodipyrimidine photolyase-related protein
MSKSAVIVWILGDQLLVEHPALVKAEASHPREAIRVVLVESEARTRQMAYQRKKLVLLFSAMRHFASELRTRGYTVDYVVAPSFAEGLRRHAQSCQPSRLLTMAASEYATRRFQQRELESVLGIEVMVIPNTQFLTGQDLPGSRATGGRRIVMEGFYRDMRRRFDVLLDRETKPLGGRWNYDRENRKPLPRSIQPPEIPNFVPDEVTREVMADVEAAGHGVGTSKGFALAVTRPQAKAALDDFAAHRLANFGPYEDAMSSQHATLFHSVLSPYLNIGLLEPMDLISVAERAYREGKVPINSAEGFIRQVLGWREYIYWQYWRLMPGLGQANAWDAQRSLPRFFWSGRTSMNCLGHVIHRALETGYSHHIERLMILCNFCLLAGIEPQQVNDWFLTAYVDAYEWVVVPNVLGMGLNADGGQIATKPYIASANYVNRMSDYCRDCRFDRKQRTGRDACPYNILYWNFLLAHEATLRANPRSGRNVLALRYLDEEERCRVREQARAFLDELD